MLPKLSATYLQQGLCTFAGAYLHLARVRSKDGFASVLEAGSQPEQKTRRL